jgi:hypothetical protein
MASFSMDNKNGPDFPQTKESTKSIPRSATTDVIYSFFKK